MGIRMGDEHLPSLEKVERAARDMRDQLDRSQYYDRIKTDALNRIIERGESCDDFIDCIEEMVRIAKEAKAARW